MRLRLGQSVPQQATTEQPIARAQPAMLRFATAAIAIAVGLVGVPPVVCGLASGQADLWAADARAQVDPWAAGARCNRTCCFDRAIGPHMVLQVRRHATRAFFAPSFLPPPNAHVTPTGNCVGKGAPPLVPQSVLVVFLVCTRSAARYATPLHD